VEVSKMDRGIPPSMVVKAVPYVTSSQQLPQCPCGFPLDVGDYSIYDDRTGTYYCGGGCAWPGDQEYRNERQELGG
jgi:hypothetical protein